MIALATGKRGEDAGVEGNEDRQDRKPMGQEVRVWVYARKGASRG